ncbi:MAG TPA: transporter [Tepidisphaeraceae bacterium]|jgi:hypothetical protein
MPKSLSTRVRSAALVLVVWITPAVAGSGERPSLDPEFPVRVEDAYPVSFGDAYLKFSGRYAHDAAGTDTTLLQPEVAYGLTENVDLHLTFPYLISDADRTGSGDLNLNAQWLVLPEQQGQWWPAVALETNVILPTGVRSDGLDLVGQITLTKTLAWAPTWDSVHLNLVYRRNFIPNADERDDAYNVVLGYGRRVLDDTTLVTDVFWEKTLEAHTNQYVAEIGLIQELGDHLQIAAGVGVGLGDDSPDFTATLGLIITK